MTKEFLEACLEEGLSLEQIGARAGRHPSTVSYHLSKHGLAPVGRAKHSPNGRLQEPQLREMVEEGLSIREIASLVGVSYTAVRNRLQQLRLETARTKARRRLTDLRRQGLEDRIEQECPVHGLTVFSLRSEGLSYRCVMCASEGVTRRRREVKRILVEEAGGRCALCGYSRNPAALQFHHLDPETKSFGLSRGGRCRSIEAARQEAQKCVLLCSNCHAEVEDGQVAVPDEPAAKVGRPHRSPV